MNKLLKSREFWLALALAVLIVGVTFACARLRRNFQFARYIQQYFDTGDSGPRPDGGYPDPLYRSVDGRHPCLIRHDCGASECCIPCDSRTDLTSHRCDKRCNSRRRQRPAGLETQHPIDCCHIGYTYHLPRYNFSYCGWPMGQR